jgi:hypothetical protein
MREEKILVEISLYDSGCLPSVLERRISDAERQKKIGGLSAEQMRMLDEFLLQLNNCLSAVYAARSIWQLKDQCDGDSHDHKGDA